ncbi:peptidylglycine alpha-hydroxylating monooxygenase Y71G12B.4-like protein [Sarcoptes scabiei]|nr:peptidylglycine alpha-hydroxylating monooxygenase Y71G12B.4-like protein [Sarcoptes scabiei]
MLKRIEYHKSSFIWIFLIVFFIESIRSDENGSKYYPLLMPDVQPLLPETYLCTAFRMPRYEHQFIVEYLPNATKETAHHILIYGCESPGYYERDTPRAVWDCGEMITMKVNDEREFFPKASICNGQSQIVYSWAMDAPSLKLPKGVGFKVGKESEIKYLVLQVHYAHVHRFKNGETDHSGITLKMLPQDNNEITKLAGVLLMATGGRIEPKSEEYFDSACMMDEPMSIHPFAFRTHTHKLGKVVSGYHIDRNGRWNLIGKGNPQLPQMFYPIDKPITIESGEMIVARCTMYNNQSHIVRIGSTGNDEMCNFYIMYYVERMDHNLKRKICFTVGPPTFYWDILLDVPKRINYESSKML